MSHILYTEKVRRDPGEFLTDASHRRSVCVDADFYRRYGDTRTQLARYIKDMRARGKQRWHVIVPGHSWYCDAHAEGAVLLYILRQA